MTWPRAPTPPEPTPEDVTQAATRMKHLYDLGIRTVISFQIPGSAEAHDKHDKAAGQAPFCGGPGEGRR